VTGAARFGMENGFFEHLGLVGAFVLVALIDLEGRAGLTFGHLKNQMVE
jgi:hypothetical protein